MDVDRIDALCERHKWMDCPGIVLPVLWVEELVQAYKTAQIVRRQGLYALDCHDVNKARSHLCKLPEGGEGALWQK